MKRFFIFAGPNGSGKSSVISSLKNSPSASPLSGRDIDFDAMTYVNADFCARHDPEISKMPEGKERDVAAWNATNKWRDETLMLGLDCIWETVFSHESRLAEIHKARSMGYYIVVIYVTTLSSDINVERVNIRVKNGGHGVPTEKIHSRYQRTTSLLPEIISAADEMYLYDNSGSFPCLTFSKTAGKYAVCHEDAIGEERYKWVHSHVVLPLLNTGYAVECLSSADMAGVFEQLPKISGQLPDIFHLQKQ